MWSMYLFFVHSYVASKIETKEKMEEKVKIRLKNSFWNHWLNLSSSDVRTCKETTLIKESNPQCGI